MRGLHAQLPTYLINFHKVDSLSDMNAYISRIQESGRAMNQLVERAKELIGIMGAKALTPEEARKRLYLNS